MTEHPRRPMTLSTLALLGALLICGSTTGFAMPDEPGPSAPTPSNSMNDCDVSILTLELDLDEEKVYLTFDNGVTRVFRGGDIELGWPNDGSPLDLYIRPLDGRPIAGTAIANDGSTTLTWLSESSDLFGEIPRPGWGKVMLRLRDAGMIAPKSEGELLPLPKLVLKPKETCPEP